VNLLIGIAVVGFGYWGPNLVRNFSETKQARVVAICDARADRLAAEDHGERPPEPYRARQGLGAAGAGSAAHALGIRLAAKAAAREAPPA